jgi:hypothetical protein
MIISFWAGIPGGDNMLFTARDDRFRGREHK